MKCVVLWIARERAGWMDWNATSKPKVYVESRSWTFGASFAMMVTSNPESKCAETIRDARYATAYRAFVATAATKSAGIGRRVERGK